MTEQELIRVWQLMNTRSLSISFADAALVQKYERLKRKERFDAILNK